MLELYAIIYANRTHKACVKQGGYIMNYQIVEYEGQRVLTTKQIAEAYETTPEIVNHNYRRNRDRYKLGKHIIVVQGEDLRRLKRTSQFGSSFKQAKTLYLWTEKGALLHAKSINTDKAWEVYDYLVDFYFRAKEIIPIMAAEPKVAPVQRPKLYVNAPENHKIQVAIKKIKDDLTCMSVMLDRCNMYLPEDSYIKARGAAVDLIGLLINDCAKLEDIKVELVEKY